VAVLAPATLASQVKPEVGRRGEQDAGKQRPYYGRALDVWVHFTRTSMPELCAGLVSGHGQVPAHIYPPKPGRFASDLHVQCANKTNARHPSKPGRFASDLHV